MVRLVEQHSGRAPALLLITPVRELRLDGKREDAGPRLSEEFERTTRSVDLVLEAAHRPPIPAVAGNLFRRQASVSSKSLNVNTWKPAMRASGSKRDSPLISLSGLNPPGWKKRVT